MKRFTCDELVELITAYFDDALDRQERDGVQTHLTCCEGCARYVEQFRATIGALGDLPRGDRETPEKLSAGTRDRLLAAFRERHRS
ncbi:anti-sigma factor family protein [Nonomuraea sp. H19]|uniref:anti-sigma factor family protein n=1 Tax=Nonomuraea sp. H19 TaxID=3452206 RepID=UPI003F89E8DD